MLRLCRQEWSRNNVERKFCFLKSRVDSRSKIVKWSCNVCEGHFALSEIDCDHIIPISNTVPETMKDFFECFRLLHAPIESLQILCKSCHKIKTKEESSIRARNSMMSFIINGLNEKDISASFLEDLSDKNMKRLLSILKKNNQKCLEKFINNFG